MGEMWLVNLDPTIGAEIKKTRPAVIVNEDAVGILPLKVIVPVIEWRDRYTVAPWMIHLEPIPETGLDKPSNSPAVSLCQRYSASIVTTTKPGIPIG
jgi:mRNA interferase MazF